MVQPCNSVMDLTRIHDDELRLEMIEDACAEATFGLGGIIRLPSSEDWAIYYTLMTESDGPSVNGRHEVFLWSHPIDEVMTHIENGMVAWVSEHLSIDIDEVILSLCRIYGQVARDQWNDVNASIDQRESFRTRYRKEESNRAHAYRMKQEMQSSAL